MPDFDTEIALNRDSKKYAAFFTGSLNARKRAFWTLFPCDTDRTQTCNLLIRSQMLYSIKLRCRIANANVGQKSETRK